MSNFPQYATPTPTSWQPGYGAPVAMKQSGLGITAFIISLASGVLLFVMVVLAGLAASGGAREESREMILIGLGILSGAFLALVGVVLGIVGLCLPGRRKLFALLGLIFNALVILAVVGLMVLGAMT